MYINQVIKYLNAFDVDSPDFKKAATMIKASIENDGIIYFFGCGHSHMFGEEFFYRAGGLGCVRPIFYEPLMLHKGAKQSSINERKNGYYNQFITQYQFNSNDTLIVISTSGINPVPIDVALSAKKDCAQVITISSFNYYQIVHSRHVDNLYLKEVGDINIDNNVPYGDGILGDNIKYAPISTILGMAILHELVAQACRGIDEKYLPVFRSGNISGSDVHNQKLVDKYATQIPELTTNLEQLN